MFKQIKNNERGVVFVTVIMIVMVLMVLTISVLSLNMSQVTSTEQEVKRIQAELIAMGGLRYMFALQQNATALNDVHIPIQLGDFDFDVYINLDAGLNAGIFNTDQLNVTVTYT